MTKVVEDVPAGGVDLAGSPDLVAGMSDCTALAVRGRGCQGPNPNRGTRIPDNLNLTAAEEASLQATWYVGTTSARVEFDLGDGNLTTAEVLWALSYVRSARTRLLPLTTEYGFVGASFSNLNQLYRACINASLHDHRAIHDALYSTDLNPDAGIHSQWAATCGSQTTTVGVDPEVLPVNGGRRNKISDTVYRATMATVTATFQNRFRWLAGGRLWPSGPDPTHGVLFSQWNYFWRRF